MGKELKAGPAGMADKAGAPAVLQRPLDFLRGALDMQGEVEWGDFNACFCILKYSSFSFIH